MTEPEPTEEKEPTPEELQSIDTAMRRNLHLLGRTLFKQYQITHGVPEDGNTRARLLNMSASYSIARSVERQEALMNQMHGTVSQMQKESERMTNLTTWVTRLTASVLVVAVLQLVLLIIQICST